MIKAYVFINVKGGTEYELYEKLMEIPNLEEISLVWGLFDIILKVEASSANALDKLVGEEVRKYENITSTMTMIIREEE
ncbi:MAG: Lrp/AsnC ligand binding domain-containing protein [Candidatus Heimdallarchaeota archaeon]